jgi:hypothetical protein
MVGKLVGAARKVLKSKRHSVVPRRMPIYYSFSRVRLVFPRHTSTYYLQSMALKYDVVIL